MDKVAGTFTVFRLLVMHPGIILAVAAVVVFRLIGPLAGGSLSSALDNISPLAAVVVGSAIYLPRRAAFVVPFGALFVSTLLVNWIRGWPMADLYTATTVAAFALLFGFAWLVRGTRSVPVVFAVSLAGTLGFYLFSNTAAFFFEPGYAKSFAGWVQCLTVGLPLPGAPPTWMFLLRSLAGDALFTALFVLACHPFSWRHAPSPASRPRTA